MAIHLETERLILRDWNPTQDAECAFEIYSDPLVTRFLSNSKVDQTVEAVRSRLGFYASLTDVGGWAIVQKAISQPIGSVFLIRLPNEHSERILDYEVGWHLRQSSWGNGYATEAAHAVLAYGFEQLEISTIYAVVRPENAASIRVTQRLGMISLGLSDRYYSTETELFMLHKFSLSN